MRIAVRVKTRAKNEKVEPADDGSYRVWVKAAPEQGWANEAVVELLAREFKVAKSSVRVVIGKTARVKLVEIGTP